MNTARSRLAIVADDRLCPHLDAERRQGSVTNSELVSRRVDPSSSLPTAMISAVASGWLTRSNPEAARSSGEATRFA